MMIIGWGQILKSALQICGVTRAIQIVSFEGISDDNRIFKCKLILKDNAYSDSLYGEAVDENKAYITT